MDEGHQQHQACSAAAAQPAAAAADKEQHQQQQQQQQQQQEQPRPQRVVCSGCSRPVRVCLCAALPDPPLALTGLVFLLMHPHETKRAMATVPLLARCLHPGAMQLLVGRKLSRPAWPAFWHAVDVLCSQQRVPLLLLFPGPSAVSIADVALEQQAPEQHTQAQLLQHPSVSGGGVQPWHDLLRAQQDNRAKAARQQRPPLQQQQQQQQHPQQQQQQQQQQQRPPPPGGLPRYVLLVLDATWRHAREMYDALPPEVVGPAGAALQVALPPPGAAGVPQCCPLMSEPAAGCMTTHEAVAAALATLEGGRVPGLHGRLLAPLRLLTQLQAAYDPAVRARLQGGSAVVETKSKLGMRRRLDEPQAAA